MNDYVKLLLFLYNLYRNKETFITFINFSNKIALNFFSKKHNSNILEAKNWALKNIFNPYYRSLDYVSLLSF